MKDWLIIKILNLLPAVPVEIRFKGDLGERKVSMCKVFLRKGFRHFTSNNHIEVNWDTKTVNVK